MPRQRTTLEWARDIARVYRSALRAIDPEKCQELDTLARARGQRWIAPIPISAAAVEDGMDSVLSARQIEQGWGIPAATIWAWKSKGLLRDRGTPGRPRFLVQDVVDVEARNRRTA
ncbi:hypothetical protein [Nocardia farcinica]|uniref:hypothetical protein n=1 Tax=Nocardia farcinica TaxID=37329 RepID=UPI002454F497|nr:hypothetical protein [Nocardia farcinica]